MKILVQKNVGMSLFSKFSSSPAKMQNPRVHWVVLTWWPTADLSHKWPSLDWPDPCSWSLQGHTLGLNINCGEEQKKHPQTINRLLDSHCTPPQLWGIIDTIVDNVSAYCRLIAQGMLIMIAGSSEDTINNGEQCYMCATPLASVHTTVDHYKVHYVCNQVEAKMHSLCQWRTKGKLSKSNVTQNYQRKTFSTNILILFCTGWSMHK